MAKKKTSFSERHHLEILSLGALIGITLIGVSAGNNISGSALWAIIVTYIGVNVFYSHKHGHLTLNRILEILAISCLSLFLILGYV